MTADETAAGLALAEAYTAGLPEVNFDNSVGVAFLLTRSHVLGRVDAWQLECPLQEVPRRFDQLELLGSFTPRHLLDWAYASSLQSSVMFEAPDLWGFVWRTIMLRPTDCWVVRPAIGGSERELGEPWASLTDEQLLDRLPNLPRVA